ncbi:rhodanese-like domain-containing protein [Paenimyroides aestuarii]|uniref:Rhodanese-like domain-containing protein n=1 Tax=Paenimyroides aestuarii TaxID=2968490 RepID=A0ABY5NSL6_9FLAO|nr:rhodanese-like domain-containing protein [Paenimyroides aestuarii]UUV21448.1 rhodanese-like domain-containing protein [Paenimyroides aestuarii]
MKQLSFAIVAFFSVCSIFAQSNDANQNYAKALVNYDDYKGLIAQVEDHRTERLIDFNTFLKMSKEENVVILDTRSTFRYNLKHIEGAVHLSFSDFTQQALQALIPDPKTKILIYCNNNFEGDQVNFASKVAGSNSKAPADTQPLTLALNIPTYVNLYGYGYRNVYELDELVNINDPRLKLEGVGVR